MALHDESSDARHDIVVVGASAGGVDALRRVIGALDENFDGVMFVVLHLPSNAHSALPSILRRAGRVPVTHAVDREVPEPGHIYVAPPDAHLLVKPDGMRLVHGPTENGHRPAIDPLFRSAAEAFGSRVIGIVLSGVLDDGTNGLLAIATRGGLTVAQEPDDALYPSMPRSAIEHVPVDVVAPADEIGASIMRLVAHAAPRVPTPEAGDGDVTEQALRRGALEMNGRPSRFTCPDCGGSLWDAGPEEPGKFRCRVGHSWTTLGLLQRQAVTLEHALWTALRALAERADLARRMRDDASARGHEYGRRMFQQQLEEYEARADVVRGVLESGDPIVTLPEDELAGAFVSRTVAGEAPNPHDGSP